MNKAACREQKALCVCYSLINIFGKTASFQLIIWKCFRLTVKFEILLKYISFICLFGAGENVDFWWKIYLKGDNSN